MTIPKTHPLSRRVQISCARDLETKERNIEFYFHQWGSMFLRDGVNSGKWNRSDQIARAEEIQKELELLAKR